MGNSEVGHNALGAGRVFAQGASLVNDAIATGALFQGAVWRSIVERGRAGGTVHFIGLLVRRQRPQPHRPAVRAAGPVRGGGHQPRARARAARRPRRGRAERADLPRRARGSGWSQLNAGGRDYRIASGGGRMVTTMDRYGAELVGGRAGLEGARAGHRPAVSHRRARRSRRTTTRIPPAPTSTSTASSSRRAAQPVGTIEDGDAVVFFNFRGDRAIEISRAFEEPSLHASSTACACPDVFYAGLMQYDGDALIPKHFLVEPPAIDRTVSQYLCAAGVTSFAISETQKFGHVTYFWNGNNSGYIDERLEKYVEIPSDRVMFDQRPWMKAADITDATIEAVRSRALQVHAAELPQRRHGRPHRDRRRHPHRGRNRGPRPPAAAAGRRGRARRSSWSRPTTATPTACSPRRRASASRWSRTRSTRCPSSSRTFRAPTGGAGGRAAPRVEQRRSDAARAARIREAGRLRRVVDHDRREVRSGNGAPAGRGPAEMR